RLLLLQNRTEEGLNAVLDCGRRYTSHDWLNPAFLAWRSTAALAMHQLARTDEAQALAAEELGLARRWGAPRALGRALRAARPGAAGRGDGQRNRRRTAAARRGRRRPGGLPRPARIRQGPHRPRRGPARHRATCRRQTPPGPWPRPRAPLWGRPARRPRRNR